MDAYNHGNPGSVREQRLNYFMENYLPKNEVLYRLPLNIQIEPFWAELSNRRKAGAVLLPLENAAGMPYWYTLTKKMVAASTRLCGEALNCTEAFDPFRMKMTSAMTQEMYFTSYVEGAQISLDESLDFLGSGAEPSNIGEQMVWNNRQAWTQMCQNLYRPMDEDYLKYLAWCLTDGMENCAEDYRQTDTHPIAAMGGESYSVPPAYRIPDMMQRYAAFLMDPGIHPLVKASAGAAYLLVTRPFPEGNERLSRMVPAAILFRSGYPFFKDISLSGVIAKENYLYYKGMCDIIRDGGDLTYFMEYFLEMLVRALEQMNDRKRKKREEEEKELAEKEREMAEKEHQLAVVPLGESNGIPPDGNMPEGGYHTEDAPGTAEIQGSIQAGIITGTTDVSNGIPGDPAESLVILSPEAFQQKIEVLGKSRKKIVQTRAVEAVKWFLSNGVTEITQAAISSHFGYSQWQSRDILHELKNEGLIVPLKYSERGTYSYSLAQGAEACRSVWEPEADTGMGGKKTESTDPDDVNNTPFQRYLDHREKYAADHSVLSEDCHYMSEWIASDKTSGMADDMKTVLTGLLNEELIGSIRGAIFISYCLEKGKTQFLGKDYDEFMGVTKVAGQNDLRLLKGSGAIEIARIQSGYMYYINENPAAKKGKADMSPRRREILEAVFPRLREDEFTATDFASAAGIGLDMGAYYVRTLIGSGILERIQGSYPKVYRFTEAFQEEMQGNASDGSVDAREENITIPDQSGEAEAMRDRLMKHSGSNPDFAEYWTLPGEEDKTQLPAGVAG